MMVYPCSLRSHQFLMVKKEKGQQVLRQLINNREVSHKLRSQISEMIMVIRRGCPFLYLVAAPGL